MCEPALIACPEAEERGSTLRPGKAPTPMIRERWDLLVTVLLASAGSLLFATANLAAQDFHAVFPAIGHFLDGFEQLNYAPLQHAA